MKILNMHDIAAVVLVAFDQKQPHLDHCLCCEGNYYVERNEGEI